MTCFKESHSINAHICVLQIYYYRIAGNIGENYIWQFANNNVIGGI